VVFNLIKESLWFSYAGEYSYDYGIMNVNVSSSGMMSEPFGASRKVNEVKIKGNDKPYFQNIEYEPLEFDLELAFSDIYDSEKIRRVARWLCGQTYYKPMFFQENLDRVFYCLAIGEPELVHTGASQGYIKITMHCDSPYSYTPIQLGTEYNLSSNGAGGTQITFANNGDVACHPEIWITKVNNGDVRIVNNTNGGKEFKFTGLLNNEVVYVDNEMQHIETSLANTYRYSNFNNNYLEMVRGNNILMVYGTCKIQFRYYFKLIQG
jgi:phage-related protein